MNSTIMFVSTFQCSRSSRLLAVAVIAFAIVAATVLGSATNTQAAPSSSFTPTLSKTCRAIQTDIKAARKRMTEAFMAGNQTEWQEWADYRWELLELSMEHDCNLDGNGNEMVFE